MKYVKIKDIKPNLKNPRVLKDEKFEKLKRSVSEFPEMLELRPIVVDADMMVLGGNMRLRALQDLGVQEVPVLIASELTEEQQRQFIIKDNVGFGEWDWDILGNEWNSQELEDWGLDSWQNIDDIDTSEEFSLPDGDKSPFQQMTFTLADEQAEQIKNGIADIKQTEEYKYCETMGNENSNGNALYLIVMQWAEQKI